MEKLSEKEDTTEIDKYLATFHKEIECDDLESENVEENQDSDQECESTNELYTYASEDEADDENPLETKDQSEDEDEEEELSCEAYVEAILNNDEPSTTISPRRKGAEIIRLGPVKDPTQTCSSNSQEDEEEKNEEELVPIAQGLDLDEQQALEMVAQLAQNNVISSLGSYQTVTVVPSDTNPGELSYVLFVSEDGNCVDKDGNDINLSLYDLSGSNPLTDNFFLNQTPERKLRTVHLQPRRSGIGSQVHVCPFCSYSSTKRFLLSRHMKSHSEERPHKCGICQRGFKTVASLQNHVNTHTGTRPHPCKDCPSCFTTSGELVRHIRYKHTHEKPHKCTECDYASVELSKLKRHMRCHTGERPYQCPHCTYASPDTYKLKRHLRIHTGEKPYECDICQARFTQSNSLKAHKLIHSGNKPVFYCEYCPTTCGRKTDLRIHMEKLHSSDNPHHCNRCGKIFLDRYSYKLHIKTHDGEKCFKCDLCDYASISPKHLETHMYIHTDQKPYQCDECDQRFRQKQLLKRHKNIYHDPNYIRPEPREKPHVCVLCSKAFRHKGNLIRHFALHDPDATAVEKEAALRLGEPKNPGEDPDGEEDDYVDKKDQQLVVFEVIQLPGANNNASSETQVGTLADANSILLDGGDAQGYDIIESADDVNNFLSFGDTLSDIADVENICSLPPVSGNRVISKTINSPKKRQRALMNGYKGSILSRRALTRKPRILKVFAEKEKAAKESNVISGVETILQRVEQPKDFQIQKDFEECFGFHDKDDDDLLSISTTGYEAFHSTLVQDIS